MTTKLLIILFVFSILLPSMQFYPVFGPCIENSDWPDAPCYPPGDPPPLEKLREELKGYYDYKGKEWMEMKKLEILEAIQNGTLEDWKKEGPPQAHSNVHFYYYVNGEVPEIDGKYVYEHFSENEQFIENLNEDAKIEKGFIDIANQPSGVENYLILVVIPIAVIIVTLFIIRRKRKLA